MVFPPPSELLEQMAAAHAAHVVCRAVCTFEDEDSQVRLDEAARRLILIRHREFFALPLGSLGQAPSAAADAGTIRCDNGGKVENLRFSLTHRFVAVQRSDTTLELVDLTQGNTFTHICRGGGSKTRWRILGFQWTGTPVSDLLVVTSAGVEFYLVLPERCALKLVKTVQHAVSWCVYSHETRLLLLATGPQDTIIHGIQVQPTAIVRIPKFEVQLAPVADAAADAPTPGQGNGPRQRRSLLPTELSAARLYNMIFCVHVDPERQQVLLYQLFKDFVVRKFALHLYARQVAVSVVDNLLLVHSLESHVVLLFDIKINAQYPITAPLPLGTVPAATWGALYTPHWSLAPPDYVVDPQMGVVGELALDLHAISRSSIDKSCLMHFLLARTSSDAQEAILDVLRRAIDEQESLSVFSRMIDLVSASVTHANLRRRAHPPTPTAASAASAATSSFSSSSSSFAAAAAAAAAAASSSSSSAAAASPSTPEQLNSPTASLSLRSLPAASPALSGSRPRSAPAAHGGPSNGPPNGASSAEVAEGAEGADRSQSATDAATDAASAADQRIKPAQVEYQQGQPSAPSSAQMLRHVFQPAIAQLPTPPSPRCPKRRYLIAAMTECMRSQQQHALPSDGELGGALLALLAQQRSYFQLHQFVQYHIVTDSPALAAQLLSLAPDYPPASELALDMLRRLGGGANELILEHLLSHGQLLAACRFIRHERLFGYPARPLLAAAAASGNAETFAAVFGFLQQRNEVRRGGPAFLPEEGRSRSRSRRPASASRSTAASAA